jgi:hypothetical protein
MSYQLFAIIILALLLVYYYVLPQAETFKDLPKHYGHVRHQDYPRHPYKYPYYDWWYIPHWYPSWWYNYAEPIAEGTYVIPDKTGKCKVNCFNESGITDESQLNKEKIESINKCLDMC